MLLLLMLLILKADVNRVFVGCNLLWLMLKESGKTYKIESLISEYQKNKSISDADAKGS